MLFVRACNDCHCSETRWPWYAHVAPASWLLRNDVNHGRIHVDFSVWEGYPLDRKQRLLSNICDLARQRTMPPRPYLLMHRDATLTDADIREICEWTAAQLAALR